MSRWICNHCGHENEFSDTMKHTVCQCCGKLMSKSQIIEIKRRRNVYQEEEKRQARLQEQSGKQELPEQEEDGFMNSWICEGCNYENEFSDKIKHTVCQCCDEPASESQLTEAQNRLDAYHREQERQARLREQRRKQQLLERERQARLEELRRQQKLRQRKIDSAVTRVTNAIKALSTAVILLIAVSIVWIGVRFHNQGLTLSAWNQKMSYNVSQTDIYIRDKMTVPIKTAGTLAFKQVKGHLLTVSKNTAAEGKAEIARFRGNKKAVSRIISTKKRYRGDSAKRIFICGRNHLKVIGGQIAAVSKKTVKAFSHLKTNLQMIWRQIKKTSQNFIAAMTKNLRQKISKFFSNINSNRLLFWNQVKRNVRQLVNLL